MKRYYWRSVQYVLAGIFIVIAPAYASLIHGTLVATPLKSNETDISLVPVKELKEGDEVLVNGFVWGRNVKKYHPGDESLFVKILIAVPERGLFTDGDPSMLKLVPFEDMVSEVGNHSASYMFLAGQDGSLATYTVTRDSPEALVHDCAVVAVPYRNHWSEYSKALVPVEFLTVGYEVCSIDAKGRLITRLITSLTPCLIDTVYLIYFKDSSVGFGDNERPIHGFGSFATGKDDCFIVASGDQALLDGVTGLWVPASHFGVEQLLIDHRLTALPMLKRASEKYFIDRNDKQPLTVLATALEVQDPYTFLVANNNFTTAAPTHLILVHNSVLATVNTTTFLNDFIHAINATNARLSAVSEDSSEVTSSVLPRLTEDDFAAVRQEINKLQNGTGVSSRTIASLTEAEAILGDALSLLAQWRELALVALIAPECAALVGVTVAAYCFASGSDLYDRVTTT